MNKAAPVGSALRAQQDILIKRHCWCSFNAPRPKPVLVLVMLIEHLVLLQTGRPAAKPAANTAVGSAAKPAPAGSAAAGSAGAAAAPVVKKKPAMGARNRMRMEELDIFDTIKEYLIGEGATEEEALKQMLTLTDEQRTEILEGSCGSKSKKKRGYKK